MFLIEYWIINESFFLFQGDFELNVEAGEFNDSEIIVMLGENGTGKTTMIKLLAGKIAQDDNICAFLIQIYDNLLVNYSDYFVGGDLPSLKVSYKPQSINKNYSGTVRQLILKRIGDAYIRPEFVSDVLKPLQILDIINLEVNIDKAKAKFFYLYYSLFRSKIYPEENCKDYIWLCASEN